MAQLKKWYMWIFSWPTHECFPYSKIPFMYSFSGNCAASCISPNFQIHVSVSDIYIYSQDRSTYFLRQNRQIDCGIVGVYKSRTETWIWKLGLWPRNSFSGNICFQFSVLVLCSAVWSLHDSSLWTRCLGARWGILPITRANTPPPPPLPTIWRKRKHLKQSLPPFLFSVRRRCTGCCPFLTRNIFLNLKQYEYEKLSNQGC